MTHEAERAAVQASLARDGDRGTYALRRRCFLKDFSDRPCDGRLVKAHLLPKQQMNKALTDHHYYRHAHDEKRARRDWHEDPRSWVWACGGPMGNAGHHGMLDASRTIRIPRDRLPAGLEEFAAELGLTWWLEREYGL
jgi:hypothetical protein